MIELRRREHARAVTVAVRLGGPPSVRRERCEFRGGRDDADGRCRIFGGGAPDVPEAGWPVDQGELEERLRRFAAWIGDGVTLQHRAVASSRLVLGGGADATLRTVFALTGEAEAGNGRMLPIGLSGPSDGLDVLRDRAAAESLARARRRLSAAGPPVDGEVPAVLGPQAAAVLVHEAVGHFAEAPHEGDPALHRLRTRVASELVSVVDDPGGQQDDEGVQSLGPTELLARGVLRRQLHSRATARTAGVPPTGNGRAALVWDPPIPRIASLVCAPGASPEAALVDALGDGVYLHRLADGYRHGIRIAASVVLGEHVRRGRLTGQFFAGGFVDERLDVLTRAVELGDTAVRSQNAMCGKDGQLLFDAGTTAPAIRLSALRLTA